MNRLRKIGAFIVTALIIAIGLSCIFGFEKFHNSDPSSPFGFIWILGVMLVFHPAFDYWLTISKRFFKVKDEDKGE